jgi:hypothetical protein
METIILPFDPHVVICDICSKDFSDLPDEGGMMVLSKGVCPDCEPRLRKSIASYGEEWSIKGECPKGVSFADWIRSIR